MKLKPVQTYAAAVIKERVAGELDAVLTAYTAFYRETTVQAIELGPLVVLMPAVRGHGPRLPRRGAGGARTGPARAR
jgi:hypothetical protein